MIFDVIYRPLHSLEKCTAYVLIKKNVMLLVLSFFKVKVEPSCFVPVSVNMLKHIEFNL